MSNKDNCSQHLKTVLGEGNMDIVAKAITDLHYETLAELLGKVADNLYIDEAKDRAEKKYKTADKIGMIADDISLAHMEAEELWEKVKPFMKPEPPNQLNTDVK